MSRVQVKKKVLKENDRIAEELRNRFGSERVLTLNLISSPGAGKTSLLEQSLQHFSENVRTAVLTGDIETENDAERLAKYGYPVRQITTGGSCHLDARMIELGLVTPHPEYQSHPTSGLRLLERPYQELIKSVPEEIKTHLPIWDQKYLEQFISGYVNGLSQEDRLGLLHLEPA